MGVHGSARFASREELRHEGLLKSRKPGEFPEGLLVGWWWKNEYDFEPIEYDGDLHELIVAGVGGGKFTTAIAPLLLGSSIDDNTVVVVDPKGEIAQLAGLWFQRPFAKQRSVHLLDPWGMCKAGTEALNVIELIDAHNSTYVDDARSMAEAMIISSGAENTHWDNTARNFLAALILYVALAPEEEGKRHLLRVYELVTMSWDMPKAYLGPRRETLSELLFTLRDSDLAEGTVKRGAQSLLNREDKERSGIISSIERDLAWIDSPPMKKVLTGKSLDLDEAARGGHKYFVVIHPDYFESHRGWLRLVVTAFSKAFKRVLPAKSLPKRKRWRHIIIDEFANLGEMKFVLNDIAVARGYAVKYHLVVQDLSQLSRTYDKGWESFINNTFQRFFAVGDLFTTNYVSQMLGAATVQSESYSEGASGGTSYSHSSGYSQNQGSSSSATGMGGSSSRGSGENVSSSFSENSGWSHSLTYAEIQRMLRMPDEVRRQGKRSGFLFFRGMCGIEYWRPDYWEIFPSLPKFSIHEVLDTVGRAAKDDAERHYFLGWRNKPLLFRPQALPKPAEVVAPQIIDVPNNADPEWSEVIGGFIVLACIIAFISWGLWSYFFSTSTPPPAAPPPPKPVQETVIDDEFQDNPQSNGPRSRPVHRILPPRKIPDQAAIDHAPRGAATRDYLLQLIGDNLDFCTPSHSKDERALMQYLMRNARAKMAPDTFKAVDGWNYRAWYDAGLLTLIGYTYMKPDIRKRAMDWMIHGAQQNYTGPDFNKHTVQAINRMFDVMPCPFGEVFESDYRLPEYGSFPIQTPRAAVAR